MVIASLLRLSPEAKIRLPNVDEALNIGYAVHSADDPALRDKLTQENARIVAKKFLALEAQPGSPDEAYLNSVRAIVLSQARGIARRKERYIQDLKAAQLRRRMQRNKIESEYNSRCYLAFLTYEIGKLKEFRQYRKQLCEAWLEYTGEEYPITASYQMVMESDIETRRQLERHLQVYDTGYIRLPMRMIRILRGKRKTGTEKLPALPGELAPEKE